MKTTVLYIIYFYDVLIIPFLNGLPTDYIDAHTLPK